MSPQYPVLTLLAIWLAVPSSPLDAQSSSLNFSWTHETAPKNARAADNSTASLDETMKWLTTNLVGINASYRISRVDLDPKKKTPIEKTRREGNKTFSVVSASNNGCLFTIGTLEDFPFGYSEETSYRFQMGQIQGIALVSATTPNGPEGLSTFTSTPASLPTILWTSTRSIFLWTTQAKDENKTTTEGAENSLMIPSDDAAIAQRVVNALAHAANLCAKTPEPF